MKNQFEAKTMNQTKPETKDRCAFARLSKNEKGRFCLLTNKHSCWDNKICPLWDKRG